LYNIKEHVNHPIASLFQLLVSKEKKQAEKLCDIRNYHLVLIEPVLFTYRYDQVWIHQFQLIVCTRIWIKNASKMICLSNRLFYLF